jgi:hypothetical protein
MKLFVAFSFLKAILIRIHMISVVSFAARLKSAVSFSSGLHPKHWPWHTGCNFTLPWSKLCKDVWYHFWEWEGWKVHGVAELLGIHDPLGNPYISFTWNWLVRVLDLAMLSSHFNSYCCIYCLELTW